MPAGGLAPVVELAAFAPLGFPFFIKAKVGTHAPKPLVLQLGIVVEPLLREGQPVGKHAGSTAQIQHGCPAVGGGADHVPAVASAAAQVGGLLLQLHPVIVAPLFVHRVVEPKVATLPWQNVRLHADRAGVLAPVAPGQGAVVYAGLEYTDFAQVGQLQALGAFAGGGVVGVAGHRKTGGW